MHLWSARDTSAIIVITFQFGKIKYYLIAALHKFSNIKTATPKFWAPEG